uniref:Apoptotic protease-activating factor 1-like n=1 Tax=Saccoglossus kowalevskii TaxID=10224 RepID=A0ABM0ME56_SACKO|nr:PREDICTED: apoptotic protease-activating factor 1-like [Saccoglossus kowalevskii]
MDIAMEEWARSSLLVNRLKIIDDLNVSYIINHLIQDRVISIDESEIIKHEITHRFQAAKLLDMLGKKNQFAYFSFYRSLEDYYPHLAELLNNDIPDDERDAASIPQRKMSYSTIGAVESMLIEGGIPPRPHVYIDRPEELAEIRKALWQLKDHAGWVMVHGMGGSGKTVMATEAVRDQELVAECFPGGVFWAPICQIDRPQCLMKMQNLCARLDKEERKAPQNIEEAKDRLRTIFLHQHPRSLLIIDDVWDKQVCKTFDIQARIMVTTRDSTVTDLVSGKVIKVKISQGLKVEQSKEMLANYTTMEVDDLPDEADSLFEECKGLPLCISMIGALLQDHPNRWNYYLKQIQSKRSDRVRKASAYEYETLEDAISMSITNLRDELRGLYQDFALFDESTRVPASVLSILWDEEIEIVEDTMLELVNKSLAMQIYDKIQKCYRYSVHNLQLDVLVKECPDIAALHRKLVNQYHKSCNGNYHQLKNDYYIHWYLARHMKQAKMDKELWNLLLDIHWVESKIQVTGPSDLLTEYIKFTDSLEPQREIERKEFLHFVSVNAHFFAGKDVYDVTQLALCQPVESAVYKQAKERALRKPDLFYVDWSNKENFSYACLLTNKVHDDAVKCAQFSCCGQKVVSCSGDKTVKVWDSQSGQEYLSLEGHTDFVNWCCFSPDCTMVASCSDDHTVRVWNVQTGGIIHTLKDHEENVYMCDWSHDGKRLVSCSQDWYIKIWDVITGEVSVELCDDDKAVKCCSFSLDDQFLVSCCDDVVVKVWCISTEDVIVTYKGHNTNITSCCFSPDGQNIASSSEYFIQVWVARTGQRLHTCEAKPSVFIQNCAYSAKGDLIAAGLSDFSIQIWDTTSFNTMAVYKGHSGWVYCVRFDPAGERIISAADDETVMIWSVDVGQDQELVGLKRDFTVTVTDDDNMVIVVPDIANRIRIIQGHSGDSKLNRSCSGMTPCEQCRIRCCAISSKDEIAYGTDKGQVKVISFGGEILHNYPEGHTGPVRSCCFSQDGKVLVTCSDDNTIKIWKDRGDSVDPTVCIGHRDIVRKCQLFDNDTKILSSSYDGTLKVWDARSGLLLFSCDGHKEWVLSCDISPDESLLLSTSVDRTAKLWNASNGELVHLLKGHRDCVRSSGFSADSKLVATGDDEGIIKIWSTSTGKHISNCARHNCWVTDIQWSPDSKNLVSVSETIKWWQVDGKCLQTFPVKGSFTKYIGVVDNFKTFITIDSAGILYILPKVEACMNANGEH